MLDIYFFFLGRELLLLFGVGEVGGGKLFVVNSDRVWVFFFFRIQGYINKMNMILYSIIFNMEFREDKRIIEFFNMFLLIDFMEIGLGFYQVFYFSGIFFKGVFYVFVYFWDRDIFKYLNCVFRN